MIKPLVKELKKENLIKKWFFIRYADPRHHIRLRFNFYDNESIGVIISKLHLHLKKLDDLKFIWKVQIENYRREVERYGTNTISLSEEIFHRDSENDHEFYRFK